MSQLRAALADYLSVRRAMGYKLTRTGGLLSQFVGYLEDVDAETVTIEHALAWATLPAETSLDWQAQRLSVVRGFASWLSTMDPAAEVPPTDLLPRRTHRATPYLYSEADIAALLAACDTLLQPPRRSATYRTLLGLLAVTGMRIGEAIRLDRCDVDVAAGLLLVRSSKFGKDRYLPLHATTVKAVTSYLAWCDRQFPQPATAALLTSTRGTRLRYGNVRKTFLALVQQASLRPRSVSCKPTLHGLRHSFAVNTLLDSYRTGADVQARLPLLSTYLGHVRPADTYWYLSAAPELLALASQRLEAPLEVGR
jgi:integrase/recombinase XerD